MPWHLSLTQTCTNSSIPFSSVTVPLSLIISPSPLFLWTLQELQQSGLWVPPLCVQLKRNHNKLAILKFKWIHKGTNKKYKIKPKEKCTFCFASTVFLLPTQVYFHAPHTLCNQKGLQRWLSPLFLIHLFSQQFVLAQFSLI